MFLLDETAVGFNPGELDEAIELIKKIRDHDITIKIDLSSAFPGRLKRFGGDPFPRAVRGVWDALPMGAPGGPAGPGRASGRPHPPTGSQLYRVITREVPQGARQGPRPKPPGVGD